MAAIVASPIEDDGMISDNADSSLETTQLSPDFTTVAKWGDMSDAGYKKPSPDYLIPAQNVTPAMDSASERSRKTPEHEATRLTPTTRPRKGTLNSKSKHRSKTKQKSGGRALSSHLRRTLQTGERVEIADNIRSNDIQSDDQLVQIRHQCLYNRHVQEDPRAISLMRQWGLRPAS